MSQAKVAISLRLDTDLHIKVKKESDKTDQSMNDIIAKALQQYFNNQVVVEHIDIGNLNYKIRIEQYPEYFNLYVFNIQQNKDILSLKERTPNTVSNRYYAVEMIRQSINNHPEVFLLLDAR